MANLKQRLWVVFSLFIRLRDSDVNGFCRCISCGEIKKYNSIDAGHFLPKSRGLSIYFDEDNVHAQCRHCNSFLHGDLYNYGKALEKKIGEKRIKILEAKSRQTTKYSDYDYLTLIKIYRKKIKELKASKNIE